MAFAVRVKVADGVVVRDVAVFAETARQRAIGGREIVRTVEKRPAPSNGAVFIRF